MEQDNNEIISGNQNLGLINKIMNWSLTGCSRTEIIELAKLHSTDSLTNVECDELIRQSKELLKQTSSTDIRQQVNIHAGWYEDIYKYFNNILQTEGMNKSMAGKERLLGLTGQNKMVINKRTEINIRRPEPTYDMNQLSPEEYKRCEELQDKIKT